MSRFVPEDTSLCGNMSRREILRTLVNQRLSAVAEDIFELFNETLAEYEQEAERQRHLAASGVNNRTEVDVQQVLGINEVPRRLQKLMPSLKQAIPDPACLKEEPEEPWSGQPGGTEKSQIQIGRVKTENQDERDRDSLKEFTAGVPRLLECKQEAPSERQVWTLSSSSSRDPGPPHIKEEPRDPWSCQQGAQLQGEKKKNETLAALIVKTEHDEDEAPPSQPHQRPVEENGEAEHRDDEDRGGSDAVSRSASEKTANSSECETDDSDEEWKRATTEPAASQPDGKTHPADDPSSEDKTSDSSDTESEDSDGDWKSGLNAEEAPVSSSKRPRRERSPCKKQLKKRWKTQSEAATFQSSQCRKKFGEKGNLSEHVTSRCTEKLLDGSKKTGRAAVKTKDTQRAAAPLRCSVCGQMFQNKTHLLLHTRTHNVQPHRRSPTGDEAVGCSRGRDRRTNGILPF
ncbi:zinc finger protein 182-like [Embiotoca jacksoni]|uniref:zinc finger protein 182-like n=1 Tax=Embiotoca jacksoni TaxID=100190 RepID=UPI003704A297